MTEQELKDIFEILEAQGLRPELYDKPDPKVMLSLWKGRGLIVDGEVPGTYVRV